MKQTMSKRARTYLSVILALLMVLGAAVTACKDSKKDEEPAEEPERAEKSERAGDDDDDKGEQKPDDSEEPGEEEKKAKAKAEESGRAERDRDDSEEPGEKEEARAERDGNADEDKADEDKDDDRGKPDGESEEREDRKSDGDRAARKKKRAQEQRAKQAKRKAEAREVARRGVQQSLMRTRPALHKMAKTGDLEEAKRRLGQQEDGSQRPGSSKRSSSVDWKPAYLEIVTNFTKAKIKVNGMEYPAYVDDGQQPGIVLPAGGPHQIEVEYDGKTKSYEIYLDPNETRVLMLELSGLKEGSVKKASRPSPARPPQKKAQKDDKEQGRVTVYSKPKGQIVLDGKKTGDKTPGTIDVDAGRHEIRVEFDGGKTSEEKVARVREGSRIKLFFRDD